MYRPCIVLISAPEFIEALKGRTAVPGLELVDFTDTETLRALAAITTRKPRVVALERLFAASPRGAALINRIKGDPSLSDCEVRVVALDPEKPRASDQGASAPVQQARTPTHQAPSPAHQVPAGAPQTAAPIQQPPAPIQEAPARKSEKPHTPPLDSTGTRGNQRTAVAGPIELMIDRNPATLVDLSTTGAQVLSPTVLKPNQRVRLTLSDQAGELRVNGNVAWATFEIPPRYRAGIEFIDPDVSAIEVFASRHRG